MRVRRSADEGDGGPSAFKFAGPPMGSGAGAEVGGVGCGVSGAGRGAGTDRNMLSAELNQQLEKREVKVATYILEFTQFSESARHDWTGVKDRNTRAARRDKLGLEQRNIGDGGRRTWCVTTREAMWALLQARFIGSTKPSKEQLAIMGRCRIQFLRAMPRLAALPAERQNEITARLQAAGVDVEAYTSAVPALHAC